MSKHQTLECYLDAYDLGREPTDFEKEVLLPMLANHEKENGVGSPMRMRVDASGLFDPTYSPDGDEGWELGGEVGEC